MKRSILFAAVALLGLSVAPPALAKDAPAAADYSVGPQYDTTHVYVAPEDFDRFVASLTATFGGTTCRPAAWPWTTSARTYWPSTTP